MRRRGFTVLEALLALAVMSIVASLWMRSLVAQERLVRAARRAEQGHLATDEVLRVLTATLHHSAASDPVQVHGDTSIAVATPVGVGLSCAHTTDSLFVPEANGLGVQWDIAPDSGDWCSSTSAGWPASGAAGRASMMCTWPQRPSI